MSKKPKSQVSTDSKNLNNALKRNFSDRKDSEKESQSALETNRKRSKTESSTVKT